MSKNLVFTSAGDNTDFHKLWFNKKKKKNNFDTLVVYYGNNEDNFKEYEKISDYIFKRKGSKFQNFHYIYLNHKDIIDKYDRFFIMDDDIIIKYKGINKMFEISQKYNLWICGPTFVNIPQCKISHQITLCSGKKEMRYVNFIEVNVPLYNRYALDLLMKYYDPCLIGWGVDYLSMQVCGVDKKDKFALVDAVKCINPHDEAKDGKRELLKLKGANNRAQDWANFAHKLGIAYNYKHCVWKTITLD